MEFSTPKFLASLVLSIQGEPDITFIYKDDVPMDIQDQAAALIGDGMAEVSAAMPLDIKEFGTGTGAHVSIKLTCNQDVQTIARAAGLAFGMAKQYAVQFRAEAEEELNRILASKGKLHPGGQSR